MTKKLLYLLLLFIGLRGYSQGNIPIGAPQRTVEVLGKFQVDSLLRILPRSDTLLSPGGAGAIVFAYGQAWIYTGTQWAGLSGIAWGKIPMGNLTAQTDLYDSILARQTLLHTGYGWKIVDSSGVFDSANVRKLDTVFRVNDSTVGFTVNLGATQTFKIRGTAAGASVLSITLTTPAGVFVSPVTYTSDGSGHWTGSMTLAVQSANSFLGGPVSGAPATPAFRVIALADLPTSIPNGNLANSTFGLQVNNSGTTPGFTATTVALGNNIILNLPTASASITGIISAADWTRFNNATVAQVNTVNGQKGTVITLNADSLGAYPIDFTNYRNGYVLAWDTVHSKLVFQSPVSGTGIASLNAQTQSSQTFATGTAGTAPNISSAGGVHTFNTPIVNGADTGMVPPGLYNTWNAKEPAITAVNIAKYYYNGFKQFAPFSTDSIPQGAANFYFTTSDTLGLHNKVDSIRRAPGSDSVFQWSHGVKSLAFIDSVGGGGGAALTFGTGMVPGSYNGGSIQTAKVDTIAMVTRNALDSAAGIRDTSLVLRTGTRGDTIIRAAGGNFYTPGWVDSLHFHHLPNGDGTWAFFISDIPSAPFRFLDSICFTINGVRACVLDSAGGSGGGAVSSVADDGTGTTVTTPTTGAVKVAVNQAFGFSWTLAHAFGAGLSSGGDINLTGSTGTLHLGSLAKVAAIVYSRNWISDGDASIVPGNNANLNLNLETGGTNYIVIKGFGPTKDIWMGRGGSPVDDSKSLLHLNGLITADSALHLINIAATAAQDTTNYKPLGINLSTGNVQAMVNWPGGGGGAGSGGIGKDSIITITSGTSSTVTSGYNIVQFNPTSVISTYTLTLPTTWHTSNDLVIAFTANSTITGGSTMVTTLTIINGAGQTLSQSVIPNTAQAGEIIRYHLIGTVDQRYN